MSKIYTKKSYSLKKSEPKDSTIQFILMYSKSVECIKNEHLGEMVLTKN